MSPRRTLLSLATAVGLLASCDDGASLGAPIAYADRREISWEQAVSFVEANKVKRVVQSHSLEVLLDLKDGSGLRTVEPAIDEILKITERCAPHCDPILYLTE